MNFKNLLPTYKNVKKEDHDYRFTVFTPIYNCESTIGRVHESLINQTFSDFEWLIINDGSTDASDEVIQKIKKTSPVSIHYINNKTNQHKMACFMEAIQLARGEFFLTFDADDECIPEALHIFNENYNSISDENKKSIIAVTGLCVDQNHQLYGDKFPTSPYISNPFEVFAIDKVDGEKWGFTKTSILKGVNYSKEFIENGFMPEGLIWNLLAKQGFKTKYINEVLRIYHTNTENSITSSSASKTALGSVTLYISNFNWFFEDYFFKAPIFFLKNLYFLLRMTNHASFNLKSYTTSIDSSMVRFFFVLLWPFRKLFK